MNITMIDGVERSRKYPATFDIPADTEKAGVVVGDYVKIGFESDVLVEIPDPVRKAKNWPFDSSKGERMWVCVTGHDGEKLVGVLDNIPVVVDMKRGDTVHFELRHILSILKETDENRLVREAVARQTKH